MMTGLSCGFDQAIRRLLNWKYKTEENQLE